MRIWRDLPAFVASADSGRRLTVWLMLLLAAISWFWLVRGHYTQRRPFWDETRDVVIAMLVLAVVDAALMFMLKPPFSRLWWVATWAVSLFGVVLGRVLARRLMIWLGWWQRQVLVFGFGENARRSVCRAEKRALAGLSGGGLCRPDAPMCATRKTSTTNRSAANRCCPICWKNPPRAFWNVFTSRPF